MRLYLLLMLFGCLGYYLIICLYTRRTNSTFSIFWPIAAVFCGALTLVWEILPKAVQVISIAGVVLAWGIFLIIEIKILRAMYEKLPWIPEYLIVLGAQVRGTYITNSLRRRLDRAYEFWKENPQVKIVVSGGQGKGEDISEAEAMERYLLERGIAPQRILKEEQSTSTRENLLFSGKLLGSTEYRIGIVTNNFHLYRAVLLAKNIGFHAVCGIPAESNKVLFLNYLVREVLALVWFYIRKTVKGQKSLSESE